MIELEYDLQPDLSNYHCTNDCWISLYVRSAVDETLTRNHIRTIWSRELQDSLSIIIIFVVGITSNRKANRNATRESQSYNDILRFRSIDAYTKLNVKMAAIFQWHESMFGAENSTSKSSEYVMYMNSDSLIHQKNFIRVVSMLPKAGIIAGTSLYMPGIHRNISHKYFTSRFGYPSDRWPTVVVGSGVIMSADTAHHVHKVLSAMARIRIFTILLDDALITGIVRTTIGHRIHHINNWLGMPGHIIERISCEQWQSTAFLHGGSPEVYHLMKNCSVQNNFSEWQSSSAKHHFHASTFYLLFTLTVCMSFYGL